MLSKRPKTEAEAVEYELSRDIARMFGMQGRGKATRADPETPNIFDFLSLDALDNIMAIFNRGRSEAQGIKVPLRMNNLTIEPPVWFDALGPSGEGTRKHRMIAGSKKFFDIKSIADMAKSGIVSSNVADILSGLTTKYMPVQVYRDSPGTTHQRTELFFPRGVSRTRMLDGALPPLYGNLPYGKIYDDAWVGGDGIRGQSEEDGGVGTLMFPRFHIPELDYIHVLRPYHY